MSRQIVSPINDNLKAIIVGVSVALALIAVVGALVFGSLLGPTETEQLVQLPWVQPTAQSFMILSAFAIALLCLGRYRVLGRPWVLWTGMVFLANGVLGIFYLLSWPGLVGATGVIARLPNTASWLYFMAYSCFVVLLVTVSARQRERATPWHAWAAYAVTVVLSGLIGLLSVLFESALPSLVVSNAFTPLTLIWELVLVILVAVSAAFAYRRYSKNEDVMFAYLVLFLIVMAYGMLYSVIGGKRYDIWWYVGRLLFVSAYPAVLFGFLQEGYQLFSGERERADERARLANQLEFERARWQATVDNMLGLVTVSDAAGHVVYINPAYTALIGRFVEPGLPLEEHPKYYQIFHPDGTMFTAEDLPLQRAALRDVQVRDVELVHRATDGREVTCVFNAAPLHDESGRVTGAVAVGRDVTQQRRAEAEREQLLTQVEQLAKEAQLHAAELDAANKELEAFSYSVSHDLRAPLRHIDGFSTILLQEYSDKLDKEGKKYLNFVREGSQKMSELIDNFLKLARVTRTEMHRQPVNLSEIAESVATALHAEQPERQVEFAIAPGVSANGDPQLLRVVLDNLIGNAWKFTSQRPLARIEFGVEQQDGQPVYFVRDNGAGFDMAYADKLFAPFQRLHTEKEYPGTGIGLATVQRIINRHGGRVWAVGEADKGATFYFTLS